MKKYIFIILIIYFFALSIQAQWLQTNGPYGGWISSIAVTKTGIIVSTDQAGIFLSSDQGATWRKTNREPVDKYGIPNIYCFKVDSTNIFAGTTRGIFISPDGGENWDNLSSPLQYGATAFGIVGSKLYAAGFYGVFVSTDNGVSWDSAGLSTMSVTSLAVYDSLLIAGTIGNGIYRSTDDGKDWTSVFNNPFYGNDILCIQMIGKNLFAGTRYTSLQQSTIIFHILVSTDNGKTWNVSDNDITGPVNQCAGILAFAGTDTSIYAATEGWGVFHSTNNGANWVNVNNGLANLNVQSLALYNSMVFAGTGDGFYLSTDAGTSWHSAVNGIIGTQVESLLEDSGKLYAASWGSGVFRSSDDGNNWEVINRGLGNMDPLAIAVYKDKLFLGTASGVYTSTNNGDSWSLSGLENHYMDCLAASRSKVYAGASPGGVFVSTDYGVSWDSCQATTSFIECLAVVDSIVLAGGNGIYRSTDNGLTWAPADSGLSEIGGNYYPIINSIAVIYDSVNNRHANLFAASDVNGIFRSTDYGVSWKSVGLNYQMIRSMTIIDSTILVGMNDSGKVYISTNNGNSWELENERIITSNPITSFVASNANIFVGTEGDGVWRRSLSEIEIVKSNTDMNIQKFFLAQNYPNPFNPTTTLSFVISHRALVSLKIYDVLGREVATIVNKELPAGNYKYQWNASNLASGVYLYRLQSNGFIDTKKLILLK